MNVIRQFFAHVFEKPERSTLVPVHLLRLAALVCMGLAVVELFIGLPGDAAKIAVLFGIALVALILPDLESLSVGKDGLTAEMRKAAEEIDTEVQTKLGQLFKEIQALKTGLKDEGQLPLDAPQRETRAFKLPPVTNKNDPQKGRFGGREVANGRRISATVEPSAVRSDWCIVTVVVHPEPGAPALSGQVKFYVHDTFVPNRYTISVDRGEARLQLRAWGAFTVGAVADDGATLLELDLATSPNVVAPDDWRHR